ncbi:secretion/DNA translocation related CpaE-like protein [Friedmanniella endophytica]|uniref:Secretion/DNA translocation related CpaE-like protein n=1 Tax=Microlunatus kandeliicorticis TaxID=1759536 RepID=A0A7W3IRL8_9ACTN|nr:septum site-determining protein Ssd [Microlunatus kandeliicorticis]MBA8793999.1 secretion/DNA translocation related CpaE-like protein [Microlunatus kandeliicorticis]
MRTASTLTHRRPDTLDARSGPSRTASAGRGVRPLVVGADPGLLRQLSAVAAAASVEPELAADAASAVRAWRTAPLVLVTAGAAETLAHRGLPRRAEVFLVGEGTQRAELERWSAPLGAAVVLLPEASPWLTTTLADVAGRAAGHGRVVAVLGGSGGVGASTVAAALAVGAAEAGHRALLVDLDPWGGGIDLLMGAEDQPGWRWPRLAGARGHVADLLEHLPRAAEVSVLSMERVSRTRDGEENGEPSPASVRSVLASVVRRCALVVVDLPRSPGPAADEVVRASSEVVVVCAAEVRAIAAARVLLDRLRSEGHDPAVLVRRSRGALPAERVAAALDAPLLAVLPDDPAVHRAEAAGEPPGRARRSPLARTASTVLGELLADVDHDGPPDGHARSRADSDADPHTGAPADGPAGAPGRQRPGRRAVA